MKEIVTKLTCLLIFLLSIRFSTAQIVYTDVNLDVTTSGGYNLDLNNDNIIDFVITHTSSAANTSRRCPGSTGTNHYIKISPSNNSSEVISYLGNNNNVAKMATNSAIDATALWNAHNNQSMLSSEWKCQYICGWGACWYYWGQSLEGQWSYPDYPPDVAGYLGLKLISGGHSYYGWVRINITDGSTSFTVKDYAYNSTPDQAILAGQTSADYIGILTVEGGPFCAGKNVTIPYIIAGTFSASNLVTVQLSDATGNFANPVTIGTSTSNVSGDISAVIPSSTPSGNGYRIRVMSSNPARTSYPNEMNLRVFGGLPDETVTSSSNTNICNGNVNLWASDYSEGTICNSYQWKLNGNDIPGANLSGYAPVSAGHYTCIITNGVGSVSSNIIRVTASLVPLVITAQGPTTVCGHEDVFLYTEFGSGGNYFQWKRNGIDIPGATNNDHHATETGDYTCARTNACGSLTSNIIPVTVYPFMALPQITATGGTIVCSGPVVLNANTGAGLSYQWYSNSGEIPGATSSSYAANTSGRYTVRETNSYGCIRYPIVPISIWIGSPVATVNPLSGSICDRSSVTLYAGPDDYYNSYSYQWQKNDVNIRGATNKYYVAKQEGNYTVKVTVKAGGCSSTSAAAVITEGCSSAKNNSSQEDVSSARTDHSAFEKESSMLSIAPNPVLTSATVSFLLPESKKISLTVYDITGRLVKTIADKEMSEGTHQLTLDTKEMNAGFYLLRLKSQDTLQTKKFIVIK